MSWQAMPPSLDTAAYFPSWDQARSTMYYSRARRYPRLPAWRQDLRLTAEQTTTTIRCANLMYHSPTNDILIFATEAGVRLLAQSNCWCGDGTFKIVRRKICSRIAGYMKCSIPKRKNLASNLIRLDPGHSRQLSQHPGAKLFLPLLPNCASAGRPAWLKN
ncbi:hypothetical protein T11_9551 [Trichinella zimbabwensis]|uniref:FLYWCH-type domain-containing protein n=1 Tax=Trichinella zimbabwensis TaxID=268475 RepID=A0A0V1I6R6_9BILA|nr:hypothetical protein T11_9551 [Trichinella zimbabwensis]